MPVPESLNEYGENDSLLLADCNYDGTEIGIEKIYNLSKNVEEETLTHSYHQKIKDETNFLVKQKDYYDDDEESNQNSVKKDSDILYNL